MRFDLNKVNVDNLNIQGKTLGNMTTETCEKIILEVKKKLEIQNEKPEELEFTMILITGLCQSGGTNRNAGGNVSFSVNDKKLTALEFQKICEYKGNGTARQFARTMANEIKEFATILELEGDLAKQMRAHNPLITKDQAIWCSNFQSENPSCPIEIREWLIKDRESRFKR
jgi:hypothetical protein